MIFLTTERFGFYTMRKSLFIRFSLVLCAVLVMGFAGTANAQNSSQNKKLPDLPPPLLTMQEAGAEIQYLGHKDGLDGWVAVQNGQQQYFYVPDHGKVFLMGLLFDRDGQAVTIRQVQELQGSGESALIDDLMGVNKAAIEKAAQGNSAAARTQPEFKTPSERLYYDLENANWIALGDPNAPVVYSFMDPQCPHCHEFMKDVRENYIGNGLIQLRVIPVGFTPETQAQAAFLLAANAPQQRWYAHLDGDTEALPIKANINKQGVQRNLAVMQSWKLNVTPLSVYRGKDGTVKIIQGRPSTPSKLMNDLP